MTVHNRRENTLRCLGHLFAQAVERLEVYLTDDACTDGTREAVMGAYPDIHIIEGDGSLFWNMGMRKAWAEAARTGFDFYLWLNDDTYLQPDAVAHLLDESARHDDSAIIVGATCASDDAQTVTYGGWQDDKLISDISSATRCETFNGNIVLVPRGVFDALGLNTDIFRHRGGDTEYGLRAGRNGIENWVAAGICGTCDIHEGAPVWCDPSQPLSRRWKNFFSPLGANPFEFFRFRKEYYGLLPAVKSFVTNFVHVLIPRLWS